MRVTSENRLFYWTFIYPRKKNLALFLIVSFEIFFFSISIISVLLTLTRLQPNKQNIGLLDITSYVWALWGSVTKNNYREFLWPRLS